MKALSLKKSPLFMVGWTFLSFWLIMGGCCSCSGGGQSLVLFALLVLYGVILLIRDKRPGLSYKLSHWLILAFATTGHLLANYASH